MRPSWRKQVTETMPLRVMSQVLPFIISLASWSYRSEQLSPIVPCAGVHGLKPEAVSPSQSMDSSPQVAVTLAETEHI